MYINFRRHDRRKALEVGDMVGMGMRDEHIKLPFCLGGGKTFLYPLDAYPHVDENGRRFARNVYAISAAPARKATNL